MGLDQYLTKKTYVSNKWQKEWKKRGKEVSFMGHVAKVTGVPGIKQERICYIEEEVIYWRKANAIHKWFVDNVQDGVDNCGIYYVDPRLLNDLLDTVNEALKEKSKAHKLLPAQEGFFFGSTDYDEWYFEDLKRTKKALTEILKEKNSGDYYYHSSW